MRARLCAVLAVAACGSSGVGSGDDDAQPDGGGNGDATDAPTDVPWETLIERSWTLAPVTEGYKCVSMMITEDIYIGAVRAVSPVGTHHEVLSLSDQPFTMPGSFDCTDAESGKEYLFAGGIDTQDLVLPPGVAIKLTAGTYINLNLHVANYGDMPLTQTSGIEIKKVPASEVVHEADMMFIGTYNISIPPNSQPWTEPNECGAPVTWNVVSLWPHMHSYGTRFHAYVRRNTGAIEELINEPYSYKEQKHYPVTLTLNTNDFLYANCIYVNNTNVTYPPGFTITYGESATSEMCFTGFYKYPKGGNKYQCVTVQ